MVLSVSDSIIHRERVFMKLYESVSILRPVQEETVNDQVVEKMKGILTQAGANILNLDNSGKKKLAYDIQHERKGTFITVQFEGPSTVVAELERFQRMEDQVMKFMTVRVNPADLVVAEEPDGENPEGEGTEDGGVQ
jgi:small subunit ribosomal protein S6